VLRSPAFIRHRSLPGAHAALLAFATFLVVGAVGCGGGEETEPRSTAVPKGQESIGAETGDEAASGTAPDDDATAATEPSETGTESEGGSSAGERAAAGPWIVPEGWTLDPAPRPMRVATYLIDDESGPVEVAITRFPGDVGGLHANVNRWRGQVGLGPIAADDLDEHVEPFDNENFEGHTMRIEGPRGHMLAAATFDPRAGETWFVKITTTPEVADRVEPEFLDFSRSIGSREAVGDGSGG